MANLWRWVFLDNIILWKTIPEYRTEGKCLKTILGVDQNIYFYGNRLEKHFGKSSVVVLVKRLQVNSTENLKDCVLDQIGVFIYTSGQNQKESLICYLTYSWRKRHRCVTSVLFIVKENGISILCLLRSLSRK